MGKRHQDIWVRLSVRSHRYKNKIFIEFGPVLQIKVCVGSSSPVIVLCFLSGAVFHHLPHGYMILFLHLIKPTGNELVVKHHNS
jgi:hypothetical protein